MGKLVSFILKMMIKGGNKVAKELDSVTLDPKYQQEQLLLSIINKSKSSEFGQKCNFESIKTIEEFENNIPLTDYDFYSDYIERMVKGENNVLVSDKVVHFNVTSGTLGAPKKIPVCESHVSLFSKYNAKYLNYVVAKTLGNEWTKGKGLSLSEGSYEILPTGISIGCASSLHTARMQKAMPFMKMDSMDLMYTSPKEARQPEKLGVYSRYLHALFALREKNITYGNVTFSSVLLELLRYIEFNWQVLCDDIENGTLNGISDIPDNARASVLKKLKPLPERAKELRDIFENHINEQFAILIWPKLSYFICVGGAGFQPYTDKMISRYLSSNVHILYLGLTSSEGFYSAPLEIDSPDSVLIPNGVFMEFIPILNHERDLSSGIKHMWELEVGKQYELIITNLSGLYRYQLKDVIEVTGFYNKTPIIRFVNRSGFAINMCAEKTSFDALQYAVEQATKELNLDMYDYCVYPRSNEEGNQYIFMYELNRYPNDIDLSKLSDVTEKYLCKANPVYEESIKAKDIHPSTSLLLQKETFMLYRDVMVLKGRPAAQIKPVHVTSNPFQEKFFMKFIEK